MQGGQATQTNNFIRSAKYGIVLEDFSRSVAGLFQSVGQPIFAIINCVDGSPSHDQYELLLSRSGYGNTESPISTFRTAIDAVEAEEPEPPDPVEPTEPVEPPDPVEPEEPPDPFAGVDLGGGFSWSKWYGTYNPAFWPWVFHIEHGFQYIFPVGEGEAYFYDLSTKDFWWSLASFAGFTFYSFNRKTFNFYFAGTSDPREFVDLETEEHWSAPP